MSYTNGLDKPDEYFNTKLYTGNGGTLVNTGVGFQPDFVWLKNRQNDYFHALYDSVRGTGNTKSIVSNNADAEGASSIYHNLTAFNSDGFSLGTTSDINTINTNAENHVAWNWKAGGTASSNSNGSITSSVSANTDAGFSIVSYTGTGNDPETIGHGLGVTPSMIIVKDRNTAGGWRVYHKSVGNDKVLALDGTIAGTASDAWNSTTPTPSLFTVGNDTITNGNGTTHIAYCFAEKQGYSKFGSYTGNGNADGTFIYLGFKPAWLLIKETTQTRNWVLYDNKRVGYNPNQYEFLPDTSNAEDTSTTKVDLLSNGFKIRASHSTVNQSGETYIYMCFASNPFVTSTGVPATAR